MRPRRQCPPRHRSIAFSDPLERLDRGAGLAKLNVADAETNCAWTVVRAVGADLLEEANRVLVTGDCGVLCSAEQVASVQVTPFLLLRLLIARKLVVGTAGRAR